VQLYPSLRDVLENDWGKVRQSSPLAVEITAAQGRRSTGGRWTRPDIVSVEVKTYRYVPGKFIDVTTFEVKSYDSIDVSAVYEALAHLRSATHSYVLFHVPVEVQDQYEDDIEDVRQAARTHGIGVLAVADPCDYTTWTEYEEAVRREPDPERLDAFIASQLSNSTADRIARALR
jgi:DNA-binding LacI/PurR family transcriptional regulator